MVESKQNIGSDIKTGVVMDPISGIKSYKDSTFAMLLEAQRRAWDVQYAELGDIWLRDGEARGRVTELRVADTPEDWVDSVARVRHIVEFYVTKHNAKLPHSAFNGQTPDEMYFARGDGVPDRLAQARTEARARRMEENRARYLRALLDHEIEIKEGAVEAMARRHFGDNFELAPVFEE